MSYLGIDITTGGSGFDMPVALMGDVGCFSGTSSRGNRYRLLRQYDAVHDLMVGRLSVGR